MTDPVHGVCESCSGTDPLYLLRLRPDLVAAVCMTCFHSHKVERIEAAQAAEWAKEHSQFRKRRRAESVA